VAELLQEVPEGQRSQPDQKREVKALAIVNKSLRISGQVDL
jgi:hypothetical protein